MIREITVWLQNLIFYYVWLTLHIAYQIQLEVRDYLRFNLKYVKRRLLSCFPLYSQERELANFVESVSKFSKVPKHLAISVIPDSGESVLSHLLQKLWMFNKKSTNKSHKKKDLDEEAEPINLLSLSMFIAWASAANIPVISLYDYHGILKARFKELGGLVQEEIAQNFWSVKRYSNLEKPPIVKFHNVPKVNGYYINGVNGVKPHEALHIFVYSREDGKPAIVNAVKDLCSESCTVSGGESKGETEDLGTAPTTNETPARRIDERILDNYLNRHKQCNGTAELKTDPDLLIILGKVKSTLGFLPWHIRLTEIHWLPPLPRVEISDLFGSLAKYSGCQQRFGY